MFSVYIFPNLNGNNLYLPVAGNVTALFFTNKTDIFYLLPSEFLTFSFSDVAKGLGMFSASLLVEYSGLHFPSHRHSSCGGIIVAPLRSWKVIYSFQMVKHLEKANKRWCVFSVAVSPSPVAEPQILFLFWSSPKDVLREGKGGWVRGRETSIWGRKHWSVAWPWPGTELQPRHVPWPGIEPTTFGLPDDTTLARVRYSLTMVFFCLPAPTSAGTISSI